jgi:ATP-binding cassette, subfamily B, bacterial
MEKPQTAGLSIDPRAPKLPDLPFSFLLYFARHYWVGISAMFLFELGQAVCQISIPYAIKELIDSGAHTAKDFDTAWQMLQAPLQTFVWLSLGILLFSRASGTTLVLVGPALRKRIRRTVFEYLQYHSHRFFISNFSGSLANRISEVAMGVAHALWTVLFDFWPVILTFSVSLFYVHRASPTLSMYLGFWCVLYVLVSFLLATRCQRYAKVFAATRSVVSGKIVDSVTNSLNTKTFARLEFERQYLTGYLDQEVKAARRTFWFMEGMRWFQFLSTMGLQIGITIVALKLWISGAMTVGSFSMVASLSLLVINDARGLSRRFLEFFEYLGNISDGVGVIVKSHEVVDAESAAPMTVGPGAIEFKNVSFQYTDGKPIFQNLSVSIRSGEKVGLVGYSGSGKTTFTNLLMRMYDIQSGAILVDGQRISEKTQDSLRQVVSLIPQEPMLFHRSLMENIRYGRLEATDDEVIVAAKLARAHDFILNIPEGYKALVGERGVKLSGGQRQRVAIARAVLKDAPILILDEATSSLDSVTEKAIQDALEDMMRQRTVIVVAHRLSTIAKLDRILVFDGGRIIEDGRHEDLLRKGGRYAELWSMQVGGFLPENVLEKSASLS